MLWDSPDSKLGFELLEQFNYHIYLYLKSYASINYGLATAKEAEHLEWDRGGFKSCLVHQILIWSDGGIGRRGREGPVAGKKSGNNNDVVIRPDSPLNAITV